MRSDSLPKAAAARRPRRRPTRLRAVDGALGDARPATATNGATAPVGPSTSAGPVPPALGSAPPALADRTLAGPAEPATSARPPNRVRADPVPSRSPALDLRPPRPRLRPGLVPRERLVSRLAEAADTPLVLLTAPVGYGKTTVLAQWTAADPRPFAWLTLDARDDDPAHLLAAIADQLDVPDVLARDARAAAALGSDPRGAAMRPAVLVLDDAHVLRSRNALAVVRTIAEHLAPGSTLALASRAELALPLARLRAQDAVLELRACDLAMTDREARALLAEAGIELPAGETAQLLRRAEGWPAALRLAVRALREQARDGATPLRFTGEDRLVTDYVRDELLATLTPDERSFVLRTAPLDRLSAPLCEAVVGTAGSGGTLRALARANVPLIPLDRAEDEFRHHPLLAEALRAELRRTDPAQAAETHRRASAWHERAGDVERALDAAIAAGDPERAGALLWRIAPGYVVTGRAPEIARVLARFTDADLLAHPSLALSAGIGLLLRGDRAELERCATAAEHALGGGRPTDDRTNRAGIATMRAAVAAGGVAAMTRDAAQAAALDAPDGPWQPWACLLGGVGRLLAGDRDGAHEDLEAGVRRSRRTAPAVHALCLAQLALLAFEAADWPQATALVERAQKLLRGDLAEDPACALVAATAAAVHAHRGSAETAHRELAEARRLLAELPDPAPWQDAQIRIVLARAELRLSDSAPARELLGEAARSLREVPDAVVLRAWLDDAWDRADAFAVSAMGEPAALTTAELRVLRLLPSHFSFREIAARLHVSANTIKTQAHAVYRKLDVSSRSEAVARARAVGLVDGW